MYACDLVAISTFSAQVFEAYAIADRLRAAGVKVAMGGLHVTVRPEEAQRHADYIIIGEGENVWPAVVKAAEKDEPPRISTRRTFPPVDAAALPVPRYDLLENRRYNRFTVQTSRGCPWRCDFCALQRDAQPRYRKRPVEHVIRDILAIRQLRDHPFIEFADDNTFVDKAWGKELCRQLVPLHLKWFTETDISVADDPELLRSHARIRLPAGSGRSGKSGSIAAGRDGAARNFESAAGIAIRRCRARNSVDGITVNGCFILGLDRHGPDIFQRVYDFAVENRLYDVQITILTAFPGTPLYDRLLRERRILSRALGFVHAV